MGITGENLCDECGENEAEFSLDDGSNYCCDCMIRMAEDRKKELAELDGLDPLDVIEVMKNERVSRRNAIEQLKEKRARGGP